MTQQSIFRTWVFGLPLRMQSMLLLAMRGADGAPREDSTYRMQVATTLPWQMVVE